MGYLNQVLKYGEDKFCQACVDCGIETVILPDLPMIEYENHYQELWKTRTNSFSFKIIRLTNSYLI